MNQPSRNGHAGRIAGAISCSQMRQLAAAHGDTGWHARALSLPVDGAEIVASLVLLADRRAGRRSGLLARAALTIGTAASLAANIASVNHGPRFGVFPVSETGAPFGVASARRGAISCHR